MGCTLHFGGNLIYHALVKDYQEFASTRSSYISVSKLQRITEIAGVVLSFDPKPIQVRIAASFGLSFGLNNVSSALLQISEGTLKLTIIYDRS